MCIYIYSSVLELYGIRDWFKGHEERIWIENWTWKRSDKVKEQRRAIAGDGQYLKRGKKGKIDIRCLL